MKKQKRRRTRVPVGFNATVYAEGKEIKVNILNISLNGILCNADTPFNAGDQCTVTLTLDPAVKIVIKGIISRITLSETAISFLSMDEESFFHLKKIVEYNYGNADEIDNEIITTIKSK